MKIILVSKCSLDIEQYVEFEMSILISPSKSLISLRWVTYKLKLTCILGHINSCKVCSVDQLSKIIYQDYISSLHIYLASKSICKLDDICGRFCGSRTKFCPTWAAPFCLQGGPDTIA